ncbi:hypothetical protein OROMI_011047 [Orobanche minor]
MKEPIWEAGVQPLRTVLCRGYIGMRRGAYGIRHLAYPRISGKGCGGVRDGSAGGVLFVILRSADLPHLTAINGHQQSTAAIFVFVFKGGDFLHLRFVFIIDSVRTVYQGI